LVIKFFPSIFTKYIYLFPNFQISAVLWMSFLMMKIQKQHRLPSIY
jgi:hypothetical protein